MCIAKQVRGPTKRLRSYENDATFEPFTDWMPITGIDEARLIWNLRAERFAFRARAAYQLAETRTRAPDSWTGVGTLQNTDDTYLETIDFTTGSPALNVSHYWVRFGIEYSNHNNSGSADLDVQVVYNSWGREVGVLDHQQVFVREDDTDARYYPVTDWLPAPGLDTVKAAMVISGVSGDLELALVYRTADDDLTDPGSWSVVGSSWDDVTTTNDTRLIDNAAVTTTDKAFVQFALAARSKNTASANGNATVTVRVAARATAT